MNKKILITAFCALLNGYSMAHALEMPTFSITLQPGLSPIIKVAPGNTATINYIVRNNTATPRILTVLPIIAVSQVPGAGNCNFPAPLGAGQTCNLMLSINGSQIPVEGVNGGPIVCKTRGPGNVPDPNLCSRASPAESLQISSSGSPNLVNAYLAFGSAVLNNMLFPIQPFFPAGNTPWQVKPAASFIWKILAKTLIGGTNVPSSANLIASTCGNAFGGSTFCVVAGSNNNAPFIMQSTNGGTSFNNVNVSGLPSGGQINNVSCGTDPTTGINTCAAIGVDGSNVPFIIQTLNNGQSWNAVTTFNLSLAVLNVVNCTVNPGAVFCQITGSDVNSGGPVLYTYIPSFGWGISILVGGGASSTSFTSPIACSSMANNDITCLIGIQNNGSNFSLLRTQLVGGTGLVENFVMNPITQGAGVTINATGCTTNAGTVNCVAAGSNSGIPFLLLNTDIINDAGWVSEPTTGIQGDLTAASCAALNGQVSCNAVGFISPNGLVSPHVRGLIGNLTAVNTPSPFLISSTNGAVSIPSIPGLPDFGVFSASATSVSGGQLFAFAGGINIAGSVPLSVGMSAPNQWQMAGGVTSVFQLGS